MSKLLLLPPDYSLLLAALPGGAPTTSPGWPTLVGFALLPAVVMVLGAGLAMWRTPGPRLRGSILHFAAGVVFSVVAVELLPDIVARRAPYQVALGFGLGVAVMLGLRYLTGRLEQPADAGPAGSTAPAGPASAGALLAAAAPALPWGLLLAVGIDILIDGLLLGIGFAAGAKEGTLLAVALTIELLSLGLATAVELRRDGHGRSRAVGIVAGLSLLLLAGAGVGLTVLQGATGAVLEIVLSFGLAALLFLVTEELLTEAHEGPETPLMTLAFFVGFLLFLLLGMVA
ncbi:ZIP family metal transporter [Hymenobacter psychrophilus]|uniref:Zinc transporter, ZIP family n=1 Tax=Hymenobacter psychrophilus TaxID=651662 RepID=A0A1H3LSD1_9BACT|nr:transporter [Hymenobacter psychrophilus]SDY67263.1 zinc transporter, ZIP family [Hymenobacter psychrophilus]